MAAPTLLFSFRQNLLISCLFLLAPASIFSPVLAWDADDYELFDLVEEIGTNFYELLGVEKGCDPADIRRAYRKVSLQLHPDRNPAPDAEIKFRQLVAVYEVLKDEGKRGRYDDVLVNGLPNWRQPAFYYRRVRKMGLAEMSVLLTLILTVGHFIVGWAAYLERRFVKEEVFRAARKKREKKNRRTMKGGAAEVDDIDEQLEAELQLIEKPRLSGLLPVLLIKLLLHCIIAAPSTTKLLFETLRERLTRVEAEEEEEDDDSDDNAAVKKLRKKKAPVALPMAYDDLQTSKDDASHNDLEPSGSSDGKNSSGKTEEWTEEEFAALLKAVAKFPGGTVDRWEKIAAVVGRPVRDVTAAAQRVKTRCARAVDPSVQGITASKLTDVAQLTSDLSVRDEMELSAVGDCDADEQKPETRRRKPAAIKNPERTLIYSAGLPRQSGVPVRSEMNTLALGEGGKVATHIVSQETVQSTASGVTKITVAGNKAIGNKELVPQSVTSSKTADSQRSSSDVQSAAALPKDPSDRVPQARGGMGVDEAGGGRGQWTQAQQRLLEAAMIRYPKGTDERWDLIAAMIPDKSKVECMERFKQLVMYVKEKQSSKATTTT